MEKDEILQNEPTLDSPSLPSKKEKDSLTPVRTTSATKHFSNSGENESAVTLHIPTHGNYTSLPGTTNSSSIQESSTSTGPWPVPVRKISIKKGTEPPLILPFEIQASEGKDDDNWTGISRTISSERFRKAPRFSFHEQPHIPQSVWQSIAWMITAIGVIYGDLGTSVIYTLPSVFSHDPSREETIGAISLLLWTLFLTVSVKYVIFLMSCDYHGEGGSFALYSLLRSTEGVPARMIRAYTIIAFIGASMLIGDGIITPAVSVLSAVEGLETVNENLKPVVLPLSIVLLLILFFCQRFGTASIGKYFGPIMVLWFLCAGALGLYNIIVGDHDCLRSLSPHYGVQLLFAGDGFFLMGGVVLAVTGCEAMFADMGHFGKRPIRLSWNTLCFPNLVLNYLGQGAVLLKNPHAFTDYPSPFYAMVPKNVFWPVFLLACAATFIASQALITGASSIVHQAVKLGFFPRVRTYHTSKTVEGQIYIPAVNWSLMVAVIAVCLGFKTSVALGNAFGMAVTFDMVFTSFFFLNVMHYRWKSKWYKIVAYILIFYVIDGCFLAANMTKFIRGGWLPICIAAILSSVMILWFTGSEVLKAAAKEQAPTIEDVGKALKDKVALRVPGTAIFFAPSEDTISPSLWQLITSLHTLPRRAILLTVRNVPVPFVSPTSPLGSTPLSVEPLQDGLYKVTATFGYAQSKVYAKTMATDIIKELQRAHEGKSQISSSEEQSEDDKIIYIVCREFLVTRKQDSIFHRAFIKSFSFLARNAPDIVNEYHIPAQQLMETGVRFIV